MWQVDAARCLTGLAAPTAGTVTIGATEITTMSEAARVAFRKEGIGVVYQADNLLPFLTVCENVRLQLTLSGDKSGGKNDPDRQARDLLDRLGLGAFVERLPDELSGGQRQARGDAGHRDPRPGCRLGHATSGDTPRGFDRRRSRGRPCSLDMCGRT